MSEPKVAKQTKHEAMIAAWDANCFHDKHLGLLIAPEAFTATQDIALADGTVVKRGTQFFDWGTAMALSTEGVFGNGWRLPTAEEAKCLSDKAHLLFDSIPHGYIGPNDMMVCRHAPDMAATRVLNPNSVFLWTSTLISETYATFAEFASKRSFRTDASMYKSFGLGVLCVKGA